MKIKRMLIALLALMTALCLAGCRFAVVESGSVRIEAPTPSPQPTAGEAP